MHSHDRTLVTSLGFADPDKKDPRHDMACRYLATPDVHAAVIDFAVEQRCDPNHYPRIKSCPRRPKGHTFEYPITKGSGQYKTIVGFLDVMLGMEYDEPCPGGGCCRPAPEDGLHHNDAHIVVEVKILPLSFGDILRQLRLYQQFWSALVWVVATAFQPSRGDIQELRHHGIVHVQLGPKFDRWTDREQAVAAEPGQSLLF